MDIDEELPPIDGNNNAGQQSSVANAPLANGVLFVNDGIAPNVPNIIIDSASAPASGLASNVAVAPAVNGKAFRIIIFQSYLLALFY